MSSPTVIIVDAYAIANAHAARWKARGFNCIHVSSSPNPTQAFLKTFRPEDFVANLAFDGNIQTLLNELKRVSGSPLFCIPGIEMGVELADQISEGLGLPTNGTRLSSCRRDKYLMWELVRAAGLDCGQQIKASSVAEIIDWKKREGFSQIVIKPARSAATDGVSFCKNDSDIQHAVESIQGKQDIFGTLNQHVIAQEFVTGIEYAVNTVTHRGRHRFTHIWRYRKKQVGEAAFVYDWEDLLPGDGETEHLIYEYVSKLLDVFGIQYGPTHTEIKVDGTRVRLIEMAARIDGYCCPKLDDRSVEKDQIELTVDAYTRPDEFDFIRYRPYLRKTLAYSVSLISDQSGTVKSLPGLSVIQGLSSFVDCRLRVVPGQKIKATQDIMSSPGIIFLAHENHQTVEADIRRIRELESDHKLIELEA